jgi:hypothetical protein
MMRALQRSDTPRAARERVPKRRPLVAAGALLAAVAISAAACSSGGNSATTTPTFNPATVQSDISTSFTTLFNLADKNVDTKTAVIQDGTKIKGALAEALTNPISNSSAGAKIDSVTLLSTTDCGKQRLPSPCAKVVYDILGTNGAAILPNSQGYAVYVNGHWLVAKVSICGLLALFYQTIGKSGSPPGC